jgi:hypothetical protein
MGETIRCRILVVIHLESDLLEDPEEYGRMLLTWTLERKIVRL